MGYAKIAILDKFLVYRIDDLWSAINNWRSTVQ